MYKLTYVHMPHINTAQCTHHTYTHHTYIPQCTHHIYTHHAIHTIHSHTTLYILYIHTPHIHNTHTHTQEEGKENRRPGLDSSTGLPNYPLLCKYPVILQKRSQRQVTSSKWEEEQKTAWALPQPFSQPLCYCPLPGWTGRHLPTSLPVSSMARASVSSTAALRNLPMSPWSRTKLILIQHGTWAFRFSLGPAMLDKGADDRPSAKFQELPPSAPLVSIHSPS